MKKDFSQTARQIIDDAIEKVGLFGPIIFDEQIAEETTLSVFDLDTIGLADGSTTSVRVANGAAVVRVAAKNGKEFGTALGCLKRALRSALTDTADSAAAKDSDFSRVAANIAADAIEQVGELGPIIIDENRAEETALEILDMTGIRLPDGSMNAVMLANGAAVVRLNAKDEDELTVRAQCLRAALRAALSQSQNVAVPGSPSTNTEPVADEKSMTERLQSILAAEGLSSLLEKFKEQGVTDSILSELSDSDLKELGVGKLGERKRLLSAFAQFGSDEPVQHHAAVESPPVPASRQEDFTYEAANGEITITGFQGRGHVAIPEKFDDLPFPVRAIGEEVFKGNGMIVSVVIPHSVTVIGYDAFYDCTSLTSVTIPDSLTDIGDGAFCNCTSLASVTIPDSVTNIGPGAFCNCTSLASVTIPDSVTSIGAQAFFYCTSLASVTIPASVVSIGAQAFCYCDALTSIDVDAANPSYSSVDGALFDKRVQTLIEYPGGKSGTYTIPNSVTSIGDDAFNHCTSLTSATIPCSVTGIGKSAFRYCTALTSVVIPGSVTSIGTNAFDCCTALTSVTIPRSVTSIGQCAFYHCTALTSATIPRRFADNLEHINIDAKKVKVTFSSWMW